MTTSKIVGDSRWDDLPNFDRVARLYRWFEYITFGRTLERCREHFLPHLLTRENALVLGDGDGRFLSLLLLRNQLLHADVVDLSARMLALLAARCRSVASNRLRLLCGDALAVMPDLSSKYDLVVTHFFLDCLGEGQMETLVQSVVPALTCDAIWLVSDFRVPHRGLSRMVGRLTIRLLYSAFRLLTGLRPTRLPDYAAALASIGLERTQQSLTLCGLLTTEIWQMKASTAGIQCSMPDKLAAPELPKPTSKMDTGLPFHHHADHIDTLYGSDPLTFIASPPVLIEDLFDSTEDAIPDPEPSVPSLSKPDPEASSTDRLRER